MLNYQRVWDNWDKLGRNISNLRHPWRWTETNGDMKQTQKVNRYLWVTSWSSNGVTAHTFILRFKHVTLPFSPETGHIPHKSDIDADDWRIASQTSGAGKSDRKKVPATLPLNFGEVFRSRKFVFYQSCFTQQEIQPTRNGKLPPGGGRRTLKWKDWWKSTYAQDNCQDRRWMTLQSDVFSGMCVLFIAVSWSEPPFFLPWMTVIASPIWLYGSIYIYTVYIIHILYIYIYTYSIY